MIKTKLAGVLAAVSSFGFVALAHADEVSTTTINTAIAAAKSDASNVANTTIGVVLAFVGLLIAAGWAWRFLKRHIGKRI